MKNKIFWLILVIAIGGLIGLFALANRQDSTPSTQTPANAQEVVASDHVLGERTAAQTLIEYGDFQCPACASKSPDVHKLAAEFKKELKIVFRHFPLPGHANAFSAARAAEAAGAQGKFFAMEEILYTRQREWAEASDAINKFRAYATELGLDLDKFNTDYSSQATTTRINRDVALAKSLGVEATPTFYLNANQITTPNTYEDFAELIKKAIAD